MSEVPLYTRARLTLRAPEILDKLKCFREALPDCDCAKAITWHPEYGTLGALSPPRWARPGPGPLKGPLPGGRAATGTRKHRRTSTVRFRSKLDGSDSLRCAANWMFVIRCDLLSSGYER